MKNGITTEQNFPPLPLSQGEGIEVRGFEIVRIVPARTLTLLEGEAAGEEFKITSDHAHYHR
jgi:hypothetical protein